MTANTQTRYDFARCTVEHVGPHEYHAQAWVTDSILSMSKRGVTLRIQQSNNIAPDEAQFTLLEDDARALALDILQALADE